MDREKSIIAQNAGSTAASLVGTFFASDDGESLDDFLARFDKVREFVYQGTLSRAGAASDGDSTEDAVKRVEDAFGGTDDEGEKGTTDAFKIIAHGSTGQPAPDWLAKEFAYQVKQGKIAAGDNELFDNRGSLPQFGGDKNPNGPWFRTAKGKVGLWPPRAKGGK